MQQKPKIIGILGGAGPLAGVYFLEKVLSLCGSLYGCTRDADFPKIIFINYPFSEMLTGQIDSAQLRKELSGCLSQLRQQRASILAIACNTLHAFLDNAEDLLDLIHLPQEVFQQLPSCEAPLVLCASTSARCGLHEKFFPCAYPDEKTQIEVDRIIDQILKGSDRKAMAKELIEIVEALEGSAVVLGCTELSLLNKELSLCSKLIIDPLEIAANKILEKYFN